MLEIRLIGAIEIVCGGEPVALPGRRLRALLAVLALSTGRVVSLETLMRGIWDDEPPDRARSTLQTYVARLRRILGEDVIETTQAGYALRVERRAVDLLAVADAIDAARRHDDAEAERAALADALRRWRGEPFGDPPSEWLARHEAPTWTELYLKAVERHVDLDLETDARACSALELSRLAEGWPLRESLWVRLLEVLDREGRTAEALDRYEAVRETLSDALGVDPSPELRQVHARLLERTCEPLPARSAESPARTSAPQQLPAAVAGFVGRVDLLEQLDAHLVDAEATDEPCVIALHGLPGSGKTTLATRWAHNVRDRFPDGQLFVNLQGHGPGEPIDVGTALSRLLRATGVPGVDMPSDIDARADLWRATVAGRRLLVVLDNARDTETVRRLLPGGTCLVVVTSRTQLRGLSVREGARRVAVDRMHPVDSVSLLGRRIGGPVDAPALGDLADICGHLPVALAVAAERVDRYGAHVIAELGAHVEKGRRLVDTLSSGDEPSTDVRSVLHWSYQALDEPTARLFRLIGLWPAPRVSLGAAAALTGVSLPETAGMLDRLANNHLLAHVGEDWYEAHDLIRELASALVNAHESEAQRASAKRRLRSWFLHSAVNARALWRPVVSPPTLPELADGVTPQVIETVSEAHRWFEEHGRTLIDVVNESIAEGDRVGHLLAPLLSPLLEGGGVLARDGLALFERAESSAERLGDVDAQATCANAVAECHFVSKNPLAALEAVTRSRDLYEEAGNRDGQRCAEGNIGIVLTMLDRTDDASRAFEEVVTAARNAGDQRQLGMNLFNQSDFYRTIGRTDEAIDAAKDAVEVMRTTDDKVRLAFAIDNLGDVMASAGRLDEAVENLAEAVDRYRAVRLPPNEANALRKLGVAQRDRGRPEEAVASWQRAAGVLHELGLQAVRDVDLGELNALIDGLSCTRSAV